MTDQTRISRVCRAPARRGRGCPRACSAVAGRVLAFCSVDTHLNHKQSPLARQALCFSPQRASSGDPQSRQSHGLVGQVAACDDSSLTAQVLAAPLPIMVPANGLGKAAADGLSPGGHSHSRGLGGSVYKPTQLEPWWPLESEAEDEDLSVQLRFWNQ